MFKRAAEEGITAAKSEIAPKLEAAPGALSWETVQKEAFDYLKSKYGKIYSPAKIQQILDEVPAESLRQTGSLNWLDSNGVREQLDSMLGDRFYLSSAQPSLLKDATSAVANAIRKNVQKATGTEADFAKYSQWIRTKKAVDRAIDIADSKYGLGLYDKIATGSGAVSGAFSGDSAGDRVKKAAIGGVGALAFERAITSPAVQTRIAQFLSRIDEIPTDTAGRISKAALGKMFADVFASEPSN